MGRVRSWWGRVTGGDRRPPQEARFTEIGTDYRIAPPTAAGPTHWGAPNPYIDLPPLEQRRRRKKSRGRGRPQKKRKGTVDQAPLPPPKPPRRASSGAPPGATSGTRQTRPRGRAGQRVVVAVVAVLVVAVVIGIVAAFDAHRRSIEPTAQWTATVEDVTPRGYGRWGSVDGAVTGYVVSTQAGWLVRVDDRGDGDALAVLDPGTGSPLWSRPLAQARCTAPDPSELICVSAVGGTSLGFQLAALDPATGGDLATPIPLQLSAPPALVAPLGDGLLVLGTDRSITAIDLDGSTRWERELDAPDWDPGYQGLTVDHYPDAVILRTEIYDVTTHLTVDGEQLTTDCRSLAVASAGWVCEQGDLDHTVGRDPDGVETWRTDWHDLRIVDRYQRTVPVAIAEVDGGVALVDAGSGATGVALPMTGSGNLGLLGDVEHPVVTTDTSVALLAADGSAVRWETAIDDEYLSIAEGGVLGGQLIVNGERIWGFDLDDGEVLWDLDSPPGDVWVQDERLLVLGYDELSVLELP